MTPDPITSQAIALTVEARISVLLEQRSWDRRWMRATWTPARHDRETEFRALVRLVRTGRRLARATVEREDAMTQALAYHDWQSNAEAHAIR